MILNFTFVLIKIQDGVANFPTPETRNQDCFSETIVGKEEEIFEKRLHLCSHSLYSEKGYRKQEK